MLFPRENSKGEIALGIKVVYDENEIKSHFGDKTEKEELEKTTTQKIKRFKEIEKILKK